MIVMTVLENEALLIVFRGRCITGLFQRDYMYSIIAILRLA